MFLLKADVDLTQECGFLRDDSNRLILKFKIILKDQNEEYLGYVKNQGESVIEKISNE